MSKVSKVSKAARKRRVVIEPKVLKFLTKLATEPETLSAFLRDPDVVMEKEGLDEKARRALTSGDPLRVHRSISASAAADEEAAEQSMAKAREVADILSSDPAVAQWLQNHYYQSLMMWLAASGGASQTPGSAPAPDQWYAMPQQAASPDA